MRLTTRLSLAPLAILVLASPRLEADAGRALANPPMGTSPDRYQVEEGCHLKEVSLRLYGDTRHWREIARWNNITGPRFTLRRGQVLQLKKTRALSPEEGERRVLDHWRKHFGLSRAEPRSLPVPPALPIEPPEVVREKFEKAEEVERLRAAAEGLGPSVEEIRSEKNRDARFQTAQTLFKAGKLAEALREFHALRLEDSTKPEYWLREIASLISLARRNEARMLAQEFADAKPELRGIPFIARLLAETSEGGAP